MSESSSAGLSALSKATEKNGSRSADTAEENAALSLAANILDIDAIRCLDRVFEWMKVNKASLYQPNRERLDQLCRLLRECSEALSRGAGESGRSALGSLSTSDAESTIGRESETACRPALLTPPPDLQIPCFSRDVDRSFLASLGLPVHILSQLDCHEQRLEEIQRKLDRLSSALGMPIKARGDLKDTQAESTH
jgi:hypothetical protein